MNITVGLAFQAQKSTRPATLAERVRSIVAPGAASFGGRVFGEIVDRDGVVEGWRPLARATAEEAIDAHAAASRLREETEIGRSLVRCVGLAHAEDDLAAFWSIDLDGGYDALAVIARLRDVLGEGSFIVTSGSGRAGRHRLLGRLAEPAAVSKIVDAMTRICAAAGFPPAPGRLEIFPSTRNSRLPFGLGGCSVFDPETLGLVGSLAPERLVDAFVLLDAPDVFALAERTPRLSHRCENRSRRSRLRHPRPDLRRERPRPTPRRVRMLWKRGVTGPGQRSDALFVLSRDCLFRGLSLSDAIAKIIAWIRNGGLDLSADVSARGIEWQIKQIPRIVTAVYRDLQPLGVPDPVPLTMFEKARARRLAERVAAETGEPERVVVRMLMDVLPRMKAARLAGLPMLRMHSDAWQAAGGTRYARIRSACGIFRAETGYKSTATAIRRGRPEEAYARSWSCSFAFEERAPLVPVETSVVSASSSVSSSPVKGSRGSRRVSRIISQKLYVHQIKDLHEIKPIRHDTDHRQPRRKSPVRYRNGRKYFVKELKHLPREEEWIHADNTFEAFMKAVYRSRDEAKQEGIRKRAATMARKKAERLAKATSLGRAPSPAATGRSTRPR